MSIKKGRPNPARMSNLKKATTPDPRNNRIRELRLKYGMTQVAFADFVGCSRFSIAQYERAEPRKISPYVAKLVASACDVTTGYVLGLEDETVYTALPRVPTSKQYVIVVYTPFEGDNKTMTYAVAYWDGEYFRAVEKGMSLGQVFTLGLVKAWMPLPMCDVLGEQHG